MHRISIITPVLNGAQYIEACIQSVLNQKYENLEYIIIDGGSTDNTQEIIKKYEKHLAYWVSEPDDGHGDALNKGFKKTTGQILAWLNADDLYLPWTFKTVAQIFSDFDVNWIQGVQTKISADGIPIYRKLQPKNIYDFASGNHRWIQQESSFWSRDLWEKAGGFISQEMDFMVDGELWSRFFTISPLVTLDVQLGALREHDLRRGKLYADQVDKEMKVCIDQLRSQMTSQQLEISDNLERFKVKRENMSMNKGIGFQKYIQSITAYLKLRKNIAQLQKIDQLDYSIIRHVKGHFKLQKEKYPLWDIH